MSCFINIEAINFVFSVILRKNKPLYRGFVVYFFNFFNSMEKIPTVSSSRSIVVVGIALPLPNIPLKKLK